MSICNKAIHNKVSSDTVAPVALDEVSSDTVVPVALDEASSDTVTVLIKKAISVRTNFKSKCCRIDDKRGAIYYNFSIFQGKQHKVSGKVFCEGEHNFKYKKNRLELYTDYNFTFVFSLKGEILEVTFIDGEKVFIIGKLDYMEDAKMYINNSSPSIVLNVFNYRRISICCGKYFSIVFEKK